MLARCDNPKDSSYCNYGGRGIRVCERWRDLENFLADMGQKPSPRHWIERINNDGNYEPGNVKWATPLEQSQNKRTSRKPTAAVQWFREARNLLGWTLEKVAAETGLRWETVWRFEVKSHDCRATTEWTIIGTFRDAGVVFKLRDDEVGWNPKVLGLRKAGVELIDADDRKGPGVRLREPVR